MLRLAALLLLAPPDAALLYRATIAAADGSLQLNETAAAHHWLAAAPPELRNWEYRYLHALSNQHTASTQAHDAPITGLALNHDASLAATTSSDNTVRLFHPKTLAPIATLTGHTASTWSPAFRPAHPHLASISSDGSLRVWSTETRTEIRRYEKLGRGLGATAWSHDGRLLASATWTFEANRGVIGWLHIWDFDANTLLHKIEYGVKPIPTLAFHPTTNELLAATWDGWAALFSPSTGKARAEIKLPMAAGVYSAIQHAAFSPDGTSFFLAAKDNLIRQYDSVTAQLQRTFTGHARWANASAASPNLLATASSDESIRLWNPATGALLHTLRGHTAAVHALALAPDNRLLSADSSGRLLAFSLPSNPAWSHPANVYGLAYSPTGRFIASAAWGGLITLRDTATHKTLWSLPIHQTSANALAFSPDSARLVSGGNDGRLQLTDSASGRILATWEHISDGRAATIAWSPDGRFVFCPSSKSSGKLWDAQSGRLLHSIPGGTGEIYASAFSPDSRLLLAGWTGGQLALIDTSTFALTQLPPDGPVHAVAFHPNGRSFATAGASRRIQIWSLPDARPISTLTGHTELIYSLHYSPDGARLASASTDQTVRLWDPAAAALLLRIPFNAQVYAARFSPNGRTLAVAPMDNTVVFLNAP